MSLTKLVARKTVTIEDGEGGQIAFSVRGLSAADIRTLLNADPAGVRSVYAELMGGALTDEEVALRAERLMDELPEVFAHVIALGLGEPEAVEVAAQIDISTQFELVTEIAKLTFRSETARKKALEVVARIVSANGNGLLKTLMAGSGA